MNIAEIYQGLDTKDQILMSQTPVLMAPVFGKLPPPEINRHRFVVGQDGMYIEAQNEVLEFRLKLSDKPYGVSFPCGKLETGIRLVKGEIPSEILDEAKQKAMRQCPLEWAGYIVWNTIKHQYELFEPEVIHSSPSRISYQEKLDKHLVIVMDLHSHGTGAAYFSEQDNQSDSQFIGCFYLSGVLGQCESLDSMSIRSRCVINSNRIEYSWHHLVDGFSSMSV